MNKITREIGCECFTRNIFHQHLNKNISTNFIYLDQKKGVESRWINVYVINKIMLFYFDSLIF